MFLVSSCIYPRMAEQPIEETVLVQGALEPANETITSWPRSLESNCARAIITDMVPTIEVLCLPIFMASAIAIIPKTATSSRLCYAVFMRPNYMALTLSAYREAGRSGVFLHVDDKADASFTVMNLSLEQYQVITEPHLSHINVGSGMDCSIAELVSSIVKVAGLSGAIEYDTIKPDSPQEGKLKSLDWSTLTRVQKRFG